MRIGLAVLLALLAPSAADAASVAVVPSAPYRIPPRAGVLLIAAAGEANVVTVTRDDTTVTVRDAGATLTPGEGCSADGTGHVATCTAADPLIGAFLGDGADSFTLSAVSNGDFVDGGAGNDTLTGGGGQDVLNAGDGTDTVTGGDGDDVIDGGGGRDVIDGGGGNDRVQYTGSAGVTVRLDGQLATEGNGAPGENDVINRIEDVDGTDAADTLSGSDAGNVLRGGGGDDTITGGAGHDNLAGGDGNDTIEARDGAVDLVDCSGGSASVDDVDDVRGCTVTATAVSPAPVAPAPVVIRDPADTTRARLTRLRLKRRPKAVRRYAVTLTADEAVTAELELRRGATVLAGRRRVLAAGTPGRLVLRVRRHLRRRARLSLRIRLTDGGGNITRRAVAIRLK